MSKAYLKLEHIFDQINDLESAKAILDWDNAVIMPEGGAKARTDQLSTISVIVNNMLQDKKTADLINEAEQQTDLDDWQKANLNEIKRLWKHANAVPTDVISELVKASSECEMIWRTKRKENDFKGFLPSFERVINVTRKIANIKSEQFGCSPYEALLDYYDPHRTVKEIDETFASLKGFLANILKQVMDKQANLPQAKPLNIKVPANKQKHLGIRMMNLLGFDFNNGRLDESLHPFCGGIPGDIRITTRYNEDNFYPALMGVLHETGHALYENNLPINWRKQPVGKSLGMSIHESQSLFIEMQLSRSKEFVSYIYPIILDEFGITNDAFKEEDLYANITKVGPSLIRVDADEVTYPFHVMLRYDIEKELIAGNIEAKDLPAIWDDYMQKYLGIKPDSDKNGCMQDIHWPGGSFGYFPTYTLGAIIAAQIFAKIKSSSANIKQNIQNGDFKSIISWIKTNIHEQGSRYNSTELLVKATGEKLNVEHFKNHLEERYLR